MLVVALTGNIASGKSTVAQRFVSLGAVLVDADQLAREAVAPGSSALAAIVARWGQAMLRPDGSLDRAALRRIVFADAAERHALNAIVHPEVEALRRARVADARAAGARVVVCDIPLLFETQQPLEGAFDAVVLVTAPSALRLERLQQHRGLSRDDAVRMMAAQRPDEEKRARANYVIENDATIDALRERTDAVWHALVARARRSAVS